MAGIVKSGFLILLVFSLFGYLQLNTVTPAAAAAGDPTVAIDDIADYVTAMPTISGTASDDTSVASAQVKIINNTDSTHWNGASWEAFAWNTDTADPSGDVGIYNSLAYDSNGNPAISYNDKTNYHLKLAWYNGTSWDIQTVDSSVDVGRSNSLAFDLTGNPAIGYKGSTGSQVKYAYWNGSSWNTQVVDTNHGYFVSLAFDTDDDPAISYYDQENDSLKFARWNGSSWNIETFDYKARYTSTAFDSMGNPGICFYDSRYDHIKLARYNGTSWDIGVVDGSRVHDGCYTSLAFDTNDNPAISYVKDRDGELQYVRWQGAVWLPASGTTTWNYTGPALSDGSYTVNARAVDDAGNRSVIGTDSFILDTTNPIPPASLAKTTPDTDTTPTFTWNASTDATSGVASYEVKLDDGSWTDVGTATTYTLSTIAEDNYTLYLRAKDNAGNYSGQASLAFDVDTIAPSAPTSVARTTPDSDNTPTFTWSAATDATSGIESYEVKLNTGTWADVGNVTTYTFGSAVTDGSHTLYLRAKDNAGNYSSEANLALDINTPPPTIPTSLVKTTADDDNTPTFTWTASAAASGIASYEVKLDDGTWTNVRNVTTYTFSSPLVDGSYTFYVRAKDNAGHTGDAASVAFNIDIPDVPNQPTSTSPADEAAGVSVTPTLESSAFSDEDTTDTHAASQWQISAAVGQYSSPTWESGTDATNLTSATVPAGNLMASTTYYWRVRHQDNHGDWSEWSAETSFTTGSGGGGCGASAAAPSTSDVASSFGLLGFLSVTGIYAGRRQKKRKAK